MDAISEGDAKLLDMLIKQTPSININTCKYQMHSPLIAAISYGHLDCVNVLIQHHVNVNQIPMDDQWTPLMHAAHHIQDKIMLSLLEAGAMVDEGTTCDIRNALMIAVTRENFECQKILLEYGLSVNKQDNDGETALMMAAQYGNVKSLQLLLEHDAYINIQDINGMTALIHAADRRCYDCVKFLIDFNADLDITDNCDNDALLKSLIQESDIDRDRHGTLSLLLIKAGCSINQENKDGNTPLHIAVQCLKINVIIELIAWGANVNHCANNHTALWFAAERDCWYSLGLLLGAKADPNIGRPPLVAAAGNWSSNVNLVKMLIQAGADINSVDTYDGTMMLAATHYGRPDLVKIALNAGAEINNSHIKLQFARFYNEEALMLLFAAGEDCDYFKYSTDVPLAIIETRRDFGLQNLCRKSIRNHLVVTNPKRDLFRLVDLLPLPRVTKKFLVYDMSF